jgi:hypothetical protein
VIGNAVKVMRIAIDEETEELAPRRRGTIEAPLIWLR